MKILYLPHAYSQQRQHEKKRTIYPVLLAMQAEYYRQRGHEVFWNPIPWQLYTHDKIIREPEDLPFLDLPPPDREFTRWWEYQDNGNFKHFPATYIMSSQGCWWGKCSFCVESKQKYVVRDYLKVWDEIEQCYDMGFKEVFDDGATFPTGEWLENFLDCVPYDSPYISCNFRMVDAPYEQMKRAKFRMLLFGVESANQETLDRINKGVKVDDIKYIKLASKAGLDCHITAMFGYPWESEDDAKRTLRLVHYLLRKGYAKTAQASFYCDPHFSTSREDTRQFVDRIYDVWKYPEFWWNRIISIRNMADLRYLGRCVKEGIRSWSSKS